MHQRWIGLSAALLLACGGGQATESEPASGEEEQVTASAGGEELPQAPTVTGAEARELVEAGAILLDVTPPERAEESMIEGRTHIPLPKLRDRLDELPRDRMIVVYCLGGRGSPRAGAILQSEGYQTWVMGAHTNWDAAAE